MTGKEVIESLDNAWRALTRQYDKNPDEGTRCGMNLLAKINWYCKNRSGGIE